MAPDATSGLLSSSSDTTPADAPVASAGSRPVPSVLVLERHLELRPVGDDIAVVSEMDVEVADLGDAEVT